MMGAATAAAAAGAAVTAAAGRAAGVKTPTKIIHKGFNHMVILTTVVGNMT